MNKAIKAVGTAISSVTRSSLDIIRDTKRRERSAYDGTTRVDSQRELLMMYGGARR